MSESTVKLLISLDGVGTELHITKDKVEEAERYVELFTKTVRKILEE